MKYTLNYHEMGATQNTNYRKSGFLLAGIAALLYAVLLVRGKHLPSVAVLATLLVTLALLEAKILRKIVDACIGVGNFMHKFTNPLMFGLIYLLAVIPTALALKLFGKDLLQLHYDDKAASYWQNRTNGTTWKESFRKQY